MASTAAGVGERPFNRERTIYKAPCRGRRDASQERPADDIRRGDMAAILLRQGHVEPCRPCVRAPGTRRWPCRGRPVDHRRRVAPGARRASPSEERVEAAGALRVRPGGNRVQRRPRGDPGSQPQVPGHRGLFTRGLAGGSALERAHGSGVPRAEQSPGGRSPRPRGLRAL